MIDDALTNNGSSGTSLTRFLRKPADLFFVLAILFGLLLIFLEPPFVVADENAHYLNICHISNGNLFADVVDGKIGCYLTEEEADFLNQYGGYYNGQNSPPKFDYATMKTLIERAPSENMIFFETSFAELNPTPYLLASLVVMLFKFLCGGLNAYSVLLVAKITNLFFYAIVIRWALRKTAAFQNTMFLLALMPMSLFQGASTSYDAILIPGAFLLFAYATKILCAPDEYRIVREDILSICFACALLFGIKIAYAPLVLILLGICLKKFGGWKRWGICVGLVCAMGIVFYLIPTLINYMITKDVVRTLTDAQVQQNAYFAANVHLFPKVIFKTVKQFFSYWIISFVGILGWLDTFFPEPFVILFLMILSFTALLDMCQIKGIRWNARVLSLAGVLIFFIGTLYTMYVKWNPVLTGIVGGDIAYGGQGRYFIPVALFALFAGANPLLDRIPFKDKLVSCRDSMIRITAIVACSFTACMVLVRYWAI